MERNSLDCSVEPNVMMRVFKSERETETTQNDVMCKARLTLLALKIEEGVNVPRNTVSSRNWKIRLDLSSPRLSNKNAALLTVPLYLPDWNNPGLSPQTWEAL